MDKVSVEVAIERDLLEEAKRASLDIQAETERALRRRLRHPPEDVEKIREEIREEVTWYNEHVERHGLFADAWRRF